MALGLIGKKIGMTQIFSSDGEIVPVTVIEAGPCVVVQKKDRNRDGYSALQLGYGQIKPEKLTKPLQGHFKKLGGKAFSVLKEFRTDAHEGYQVGDQIDVNIFSRGERVSVSGISKGKGFAGNIKRWGFNRGPMSHGSKFHRVVGSIGSSAWPSRVFKGKRMPGHLGAEKVTVKNLEIVDLRADENIVLVRGAVPGGKNSIVTILKNKG
ncbi:MAG: 50S ribosomal protein L3 [Desulfobacterota bacterium]|nr:50S ribosomal protein L3 [Thermodesulfobacteriota bacterium]